ncbi:hypothetical protein EXS62_00565 [Candidatus Kaiserbacteria bacterium]|nr:hypothetical protein [Candidatus Kaiserbacteria bacterium]
MKRHFIWFFITVALLWGIGVAGSIVFECQGALGSGVRCAKGGPLGLFMEGYLPSMEIGLIFVIFLGIPVAIVVGSIMLFRRISKQEKVQSVSAPNSTQHTSWTKYLLLIPTIGIGIIFLLNILFD